MSVREWNKERMKNQLILGDNLEVLKDIPSESVDLIYIDPPFFSNRHYEVIWGDEGEVASFNDRWAGGINHYIDWLYKRVEQLYRVLKPTGSFYLHCDWHANAYIRVMILDKIFGDKNFINEIVWRYGTYMGKVDTLKSFPKKYDSIFFYKKSENYTFSGIPFLGNFKDTVDGKRWRNYLIGNKIIEGKHPKTDSRFTAYRNKWIKEHGREPSEGEVIYTCKGDIVTDTWVDIKAVDPKSKERIGYPTQKPEALLERIIKASSNEGDIVLDAFCGGGTTPAVARRLGRKFIGIDQSVRAIAVSNARLEKQTDLIVNDVYEVKTKSYDYEKLRNMDAFKFERLMVELFGGVPNIKQRSDGGKDGVKRIDGVALPIQVKQQNNVGRPQIQNFVGHLVQNKMARGFFIAFDFAKTACECVAEVKQNIGITIDLIKVEDIIPLVKKTEISLDWNYETIEEKQQVTLIASGTDIVLWQWDFDYDETRGFSAEILKDIEGKQKIALGSGKHIIAVRGIDSAGIENIKTITLYSNGSVHE